jgi:hypothetical protein
MLLQIGIKLAKLLFTATQRLKSLLGQTFRDKTVKILA